MTRSVTTAEASDGQGWIGYVHEDGTEIYSCGYFTTEEEARADAQFYATDPQGWHDTYDRDDL